MTDDNKPTTQTDDKPKPTTERKKPIPCVYTRKAKAFAAAKKLKHVMAQVPSGFVLVNRLDGEIIGDLHQGFSLEQVEGWISEFTPKVQEPKPPMKDEAA
jgi:hypothetical protein